MDADYVVVAEDLTAAEAAAATVDLIDLVDTAETVCDSTTSIDMQSDGLYTVTVGLAYLLRQRPLVPARPTLSGVGPRAPSAWRPTRVSFGRGEMD